MLGAGFGFDRGEDTLKFAGLAPVNQYHAHVVARPVARIQGYAVDIDNVNNIIVAVKIAKKCGIFRIHRAICAITRIPAYNNSCSAIIFHLLQRVDSHLPFKARNVEYTVVNLFCNGAERRVCHNNVRFLAVERQQCILSRHLTVAKPAEIGEAGVINIVNLNYRGTDCNSQRAVAGARLKHTVNLLAPGLHKLSHDVTERRRR